MERKIGKTHAHVDIMLWLEAADNKPIKKKSDSPNHYSEN